MRSGKTLQFFPAPLAVYVVWIAFHVISMNKLTILIGLVSFGDRSEKINITLKNFLCEVNR